MLASDEVCREEISLSTVLEFPEDLSVQFIPDKYLVIAPAYANWLVFSGREYDVFRALQAGKNIGAAIAIENDHGSADAEQLVSLVVGQILAKQFLRNANVTSIQNFQSASAFLTDGCNLRCKTCYRKATVAGSDEMSANDWKTFFHQFAELGGKVVTFSGGDPLTRADGPQILESAKSFGLQVVLLTNGTLFTKDNVASIVHSCDEIQVSIDGPNSESNDAIRGEGSYKQAIEGLKLIRYSPCRISIAMTPTPETLPAFEAHLSAFVKWVERHIGPDVIIRVTDRLLEGRSEACTKCDPAIFGQRIVDLCNKHLEPGWFDKLDAAAIVPNRRVTGCGYAQAITIGANGDIFACGFCETEMTSFRINWLRSVIDKLAGLFSLTRVEMLNPCASCDLRYFCGGGCRLENKRIRGSMQVASCSEAFRRGWYERLVRINPFFFNPVSEGDTKGDE